MPILLKLNLSVSLSLASSRALPVSVCNNTIVITLLFSKTGLSDDDDDDKTRFGTQPVWHSEPLKALK